MPLILLPVALANFAYPSWVFVCLLVLMLLSCLTNSSRDLRQWFLFSPYLLCQSSIFLQSAHSHLFIGKVTSFGAKAQTTSPFFVVFDQFFRPHSLILLHMLTPTVWRLVTNRHGFSLFSPSSFCLCAQPLPSQLLTHAIISAARISMNWTLGAVLYSFSYHCAHPEVILSHLTAAFQKSVLSSSEPLDSCV